MMLASGKVQSTTEGKQTFIGEYTAEWQWDMKRNTNWLNLLRLNLNVPVFDGKGTIEASTLHIAKLMKQS